ncbi:hypothetical protein LIA77_03478 [Sarocladium implicatum]|nr:hypothetical protein LIA77_03478 [Sarocladium implicatum]
MTEFQAGKQGLFRNDGVLTSASHGPPCQSFPPVFFGSWLQKSLTSSAGSSLRPQDISVTAADHSRIEMLEKSKTNRQKGPRHSIISRTLAMVFTELSRAGNPPFRVQTEALSLFQLKVTASTIGSGVSRPIAIRLLESEFATASATIGADDPQAAVQILFAGGRNRLQKPPRQAATIQKAGEANLILTFEPCISAGCKAVHGQVGSSQDSVSLRKQMGGIRENCWQCLAHNTATHHIAYTSCRAPRAPWPVAAMIGGVCAVVPRVEKSQRPGSRTASNGTTALGYNEHLMIQIRFLLPGPKSPAILILEVLATSSC